MRAWLIMSRTPSSSSTTRTHSSLATTIIPPIVAQERANSEGQFDAEGGAFAGTTGDGDGAAHGLDHAPRDPQAEAQAGDVHVGGGALEALEDARLIGVGDADALIAHLHQRAFS